MGRNVPRRGLLAMLPFTPGLDIHALADAGLITAQQYDAAMRYRALWLAYRQPWAFSLTIPWGEHATLTEAQNWLADRFRKAQAAVESEPHLRVLGRVVLHDRTVTPEVLPWISATLTRLVEHFQCG